MKFVTSSKSNHFLVKKKKNPQEINHILFSLGYWSWINSLRSQSGIMLSPEISDPWLVSLLGRVWSGQ